VRQRPGGMMTTISMDFTTQQSVPDDGDTLTIAVGVNGIVKGTAINANTVADDRNITVEGHIEAHGSLKKGPTAIDLGVFTESEDSTGNVIEVTASGSLEARDTGIQVCADGTQITNDGSIRGFYGIYANMDGGRVINNGVITAHYVAAHFFDCSVQVENAGTLKSIGDYGLWMYNGLNSVTNTGTISASNGTAISLQSNAGQANFLENKGTIDGGVAAFKGGAGDEEIRNYGTISGDVMLGDGENSFILKNGSVDGTVYGGVDADSYKIEKGSLEISEAKGGSDQDHLYANVDVVLPKNIELLTLSGSADIDGTGNGSNNSIFGNAQDNIIKGGKGDDFIDAFKGKDMLTGGQGADTFYFDDKYGKDTITDFDDGIDKIAPYNHSATPDYDSLKAHMSQVGDDVVIDFGGGDALTIENIKLNHLTKNDFVEL
jgi:Ca2+-binding RTX toxin-like protein